MWGFSKRFRDDSDADDFSVYSSDSKQQDLFTSPMLRRSELEALIDRHPALARKILITLFENSPQSRHVNLAIAVVSAEMGVQFCRDRLERFVMERPGLAQDAAKQLIRFRTDEVEPIIQACVLEKFQSHYSH